MSTNTTHLSQLNTNDTNTACIDYFRNLNRIKAKRKNGVILYDNNKLKQESFSLSLANIFTLGKTPLYGKQLDYSSISSIATSSMLNKLYHPNPPQIIIEDAGNHLNTATENITQLSNQDYEVVLAYNDKNMDNVIDYTLENVDLDVMHAKYGKWFILYNKDIKQKFLEIMTEDCFDELVNHYLAAELRTGPDRHVGNYFFVKKKGSPKYETIIQIDFDNNEILKHTILINKDFQSFIRKKKYISMDFIQFFDNNITYEERMIDLQSLIQDNALNAKQILQLKEILKYNFPQEIRKVTKRYAGNHKIEKLTNQTYDTMSRLWEYNREVLGKELNL